MPLPRPFVAIFSVLGVVLLVFGAFSVFQQMTILVVATNIPLGAPLRRKFAEWQFEHGIEAGPLKRVLPLLARMTLQLETLEIQEGKPFKGIAILESKESFKVEKVRLEIRIEESFDFMTPKGRRTRATTVYSRDVPVSEAFDVRKGEKIESPFEATIPVYPSHQHNGKVFYSFKAVANVKGHPDVTEEVHPHALRERREAEKEVIP